MLVAADDWLMRRVLSHHLGVWGYGAVEVDSGVAALEALEGEDAPRLALID